MVNLLFEYCPMIFHLAYQVFAIDKTFEPNTTPVDC